MSAPLAGGVGLLERAISYTLGSLHLVTLDAMARPTPCAGWDLCALLAHMNDSLVALQEAADRGRVELVTAPRDGAASHRDAGADPVGALKRRACGLLGAWANTGGDPAIAVADRSLKGTVVAGAGALEITVHGWDVAQACGQTRPIPAPLADELLVLAPLLVSDADRPGRFAPAVAVAPTAGPGEQLLAFLGRQVPLGDMDWS